MFLTCFFSCSLLFRNHKGQKVMAFNAAACAERAMSEKLNSPDWAINIELCDIINTDPRQAKDALKILKKRLTSKNPKIQLLALFLLETLSKNCGENVFQPIVERDILHEMVKIVKKKPELNVREKILILIDTWQEALGGSNGGYPQYYKAYSDLLAAGVEFPPRVENSVPIFTPPQTHPITAIHHPSISAFEDDAAIQASLQSEAAVLSLSDIKNAQGLADVLMEMLGALDPKKPEALKEEVIVDLVDQCRSYQKRVTFLVNNSVDEELLCQGLALNDTLQRVLTRHGEISQGTSSTGTGATTETSGMPMPFLNVSGQDDEYEDELPQLSHRSSSRDNGLSKKPASKKPEPSQTNPIFQPPPPSKDFTSSESGAADYLSGDLYRSTEFPHASSSASPFSLNPAVKPSSPPHPILASQKPVYDEPGIVSREVSSGAGAVPFPHPHHSSGSSSYDSLVNQAHGLSISSSGQPKSPNQEDALFKDLVDFAKAKSSSSAASKPNRSF
ncbi:hypothetical protein SAY87_020777 [Trapa incisa]|uniref:Target of Myb protein 1 n=1 Tax=Trapa incisa TaxID=236973 RepID=A0AAN7JQE7_9MYRT|nr:hypothetical protein SAY87_020777 [Trapa incisa]